MRLSLHSIREPSSGYAAVAKCAAAWTILDGTLDTTDYTTLTGNPSMPPFKVTEEMHIGESEYMWPQKCLDVHVQFSLGL